MNEINGTIQKINDWHNALKMYFPSVKKIGQPAIENIADFIDLFKSTEEKSADELTEFQQRRIHFEWAEEAKQLALFYRNTTFHLFKKEHLKSKMGGAPLSQMEQISEQAKDANIGLLRDILTTHKVDEASVNVWKHYNSPIKELSGQLEAISSQLDMMLSSSEELERMNRDIVFYEIQIQQILEKKLDFIKQTLKKVDHLQTNLRPEITFSELDQQIKSIIKSVNQFLEHDDIPDIHYEKELKSKVPVRMQDAQLVVKEIDFKRQINYWIDSVVMPKLISAHQLSQQLAQKVLLTMSSLEGRIRPEAGEDEENVATEIDELDRSMSQLLNYLKAQKENFIQKESDLVLQVKNDLSLGNIFSDERFFLVNPNQLALKRYGQSTQDFILNEPIQKIKGWYENFAQNYLFLDVKSTDKKATFNFIDAILIEEEIAASSDAFFLKGYLSDSFIVPRTNLNDRVLDSIKLWKNGFQGSALVFGEYLSGRSSLLGALANQSVVPSIHLVPNQINVWQNNKFETSYNISESLDRIFKMMHEDDRLLVLIDDLELWRNPEHDAYQNMRRLIRSMQDYGRKMYFVVATNHWYKDYLDSFFQFSDLFAEVLNVSRMDKDALVSAILKRHLASANEDQLHPDNYLAKEEEWLQEINNICRERDFNVGAGLQEWYWQMNQADEMEKQILYPPKSFLKLIDKHQVLLQYILKFNAISEVEISRMLGGSNIRVLKEDIRQLLGKKILKRSVNGALSINEQLIYFVEKTLNQLIYVTH